MDNQFDDYRTPTERIADALERIVGFVEVFVVNMGGSLNHAKQEKETAAYQNPGPVVAENAEIGSD